jgi:putative membrane protein
VKAFAQLPAEEGRLAGVLLYDFALELKQHLRDRRSGHHRPVDVARAIYALLRDWQNQKKLTEFDMLMLDPHVRALMDICGACERIQTTPVPLSYRSLLRHGTILYLASAPWFMAGEFGYWSVAVVGLIAYFLLGTELTAESIEEPFGLAGDDLELAKYCETIRKSVQEILQIELTPTL